MSDVTHPSDDRLSDLVMGLLDRHGTESTLQHISDCPSCEERFRKLGGQWEHAAIRSDELRRTATDHTVGHEEGPVRWLHNPAARWVAAAALVAALAFAIVPRVVESPGRPQLTTLPPLSQEIRPRAATPESGDALFRRGLDAYASGDFDGAIAALESVDATGPADAMRRIYLASALAWTDRYEDAVEVLAGVHLDAVPDPWSAEAYWTLYVSLDAVGSTDEARAALEALRDRPGEIGERARAALDRSDRR